MSSPFDNAKYKALLEGLEITVLPESEVFVENPTNRIDSEFLSKDAIASVDLIKRAANQYLKTLVSKIQHPAELTREYAESGLHVVLAQNVRDNLLSFPEKAFMSLSVKAFLAPNRLKYDDVLMTRSGANFGQTACWKLNEEAYACADLLIFRQPKCPGGYLSTFFNTCYGKKLVERGSYGMAQPHIAPNYLEIVRVPRFELIETRVDEFIVKAYCCLANSANLYQAAEQTLLSALGLDSWQPPEQLSYTRKASETFTAGRLDAEYFRPKYDELIDGMKTKMPLMAMREVSQPLKYGTSEPLTYSEEGFPFLRIADLQNKRFEIDSVMRIPLSQAKYISEVVSTGDVLISRSGTLGVAVPITDEFNGAIYGSYFIRTKPDPEIINPEYMALFINSLAGQLQVEQKNTGGVQMNLTIDAIENIQIPIGSLDWQQQIVNVVEMSLTARKEARSLLKRAKRAVEIAIERNEAAAIECLNQAEGGF